MGVVRLRKSLLLLVLLFSVSLVSAYTIDGDTVREENGYLSLEVTPHTSYSINNHEQTFTVRAEKAGDLCIAYVFDHPLESGKASLRKEGTRQVTRYSQTCNPLETQNGTIQECTSIPYQASEQYTHWEEKTGAFSMQSYRGRTAYYNTQPLHFDVGQTRTWKVRYTPDEQEDGKWELYGWNVKNGATCLEAMQDSKNRDFLLMMDPWYDSTWNKRLNVTINSSQVPGALTDYPIYVDLSDFPSTFWGNISSCGELRVTQNDGETELPREIVSCNTTAETGEMHFKANLTGGTDSFVVYFNNSAAGDYAVSHQYGRNSVWTEFDAVYHVREGTGSTSEDSTGNNNGTYNGNLPTRTEGVVDGAQDYDGTDDYFSVSGSPYTVQDGFQYSAWVNISSSTSLFTRLFEYDPGTGMEIMIDRDTPRYISRNDITTNGGHFTDTSTLIFNEWQHVVVSIEGDNVVWYLNGTSIPDNTNTNRPAGTSTAYFGVESDSSDDFKGFVDEIRISTSGRNADWIATEYNNQKSPSTFYTVGNVETSIANEAQGRTAIVSGLDSSEIGGSYTSHTDRKVHVRLANGSQYQGTFDIFVEAGSKRWAFNYDETDTSNFPIMKNVTPVFWVWQKASMTELDISSDVTSFVDGTN